MGMGGDQPWDWGDGVTFESARGFGFIILVQLRIWTHLSLLSSHARGLSVTREVSRLTSFGIFFLVNVVILELQC